MTRHCERCGVPLTKEDVMKIKIDEGSWETIPLPLCSHCFTERMRTLASKQHKT